MRVTNRQISVLALAPFLVSLAQAQTFTTTTWPADIKATLDASYMTDGDWEGHLDVYAQAGKTSSAPTIIWWHGRNDSKEAQFLRILPLLEMGFSVVLPQAKDSPTTPFAATLKDGSLERVNTARCAVHWVMSHAAEHGLATDQLILAGASVGGYTALMAGLSAGIEGEDAGCPGAARPNVAAIVDFFGPTGAPAGSPDDVPALRVQTWLTANQPPLLVIQGDADRTGPFETSEALRVATTNVGASIEFLRVEGAPHSFVNWTPAQLNQAWAKVHAFFQSHNLLPSRL